MLKCMDEMKSAHLRNLPKAGLTTCGFENCVTLTRNSKQFSIDFGHGSCRGRKPLQVQRVYR